MRICPTCGDAVASALRCCPRCTGPLPEPRTGYGWPPGYPGEPGYPAETGYLPAPDAAEADYLAAPYLAEPGYRVEPGYGPEPYGRARYEPAAHEDATGPQTFGDRFARAGPKTSGFPPWHAPEPEALPEEDTASRLVYAPPGRPHPAPRHRARIAGAVLGTVAVLAGVITAWVVFGQDRAPGPAWPAARPRPRAGPVPPPAPPRPPHRRPRPPAMAPAWWPWLPG